MVKYILTLTICICITMIVSMETGRRCFLNGHKQGFEEGVSVVRDNVNLLINRPGVKKQGLWRKTK